MLAWYLFWHLRGKHFDCRILTFHDIGNKVDLSINRTTVSGFDSILDYLKENGFNGTSLSQQRHEKDVALTFDDGWESFYKNAFPVLQKYNFSATVFVVTDYIGKFSAWDYQKKRHLNWKQISELSAAGIEIASHSATHTDLRGLNDSRLRHEIINSKKTLEDKLGKPVKYFSYPFGRYDNRAMEMIRTAGYENAYILTGGGDDYALARHSVYLYDTPYSIYLKLMKHSRLERCKDYINNSLAGGTIILRKFAPVRLPRGN